MARVAIVDSSPIIALVSIDQLSLLDNLFDKVVVTLDVWNELAGKHNAPEPSALMRLASSRIVPVVAVTGDELAGLDAGERSVILAAKPSDDVVLLIDEKKGRNIASGRGFKVRGTLAVLVEGKRRGLVAAVRPLILRLRSQGFRLSDKLVKAAIQRAGEEAY